MKKIDDEIEIPLIAIFDIFRYLSSENEIEAKKLYIEPLKKDYPEEDIEKWCAAVYKQMLLLKVGKQMIKEMLKLRELFRSGRNKMV